MRRERWGVKDRKGEWEGGERKEGGNEMGS